jgi:hypothetical protein
MFSRICAALLFAVNLALGCSAVAAQENSATSNRPDLILVLEPTPHAYEDAVRNASEGIPVLSAVPDWNSLSDRLDALGAAAEDGSLSSVQQAMAAVAAILTAAGIDPVRLEKYREVLVVSPRPVPMDLLTVAGEPLGRRVIFEHCIAANTDELRAELPKYLVGDHASLQRVALLAIVPMPEGIPRANQDIVKAALKLSATVPVDLVIEPSGRESVEYFSRDDVSILHLDTHGSPDAVELGTNEEHFYGARDLPSRIRPPLILLVGCSTGAGAASLAPYLVKRGAKAVIGMAFVFRSGDPSGGDITNPLFYDTLWSAIAQGQPIGEALLRAKQAMPNNDWSAMWLLFGNANLRFDAPQARVSGN